MRTPRPSRMHRGLAVVLLAAATGGCALVGGSKADITVYAPDPRITADPAWPNVRWQLAIDHPEAARVVDSLRIAVRPAPAELEVYKGAHWAKTPSEQLQDTVLRGLEDSQKIAAVAREGTGLVADYTLVTDLRRYEADYAGGTVPRATIEVNAKLLHTPGQDIVASHTFLQAVPANGTAMPQVAHAFEQALGAIGHDIAGWTLTQGEAHQQQHPTGR
jgi:cholesterol transport system auxiliary component